MESQDFVIRVSKSDLRGLPESLVARATAAPAEEQVPISVIGEIVSMAIRTGIEAAMNALQPVSASGALKHVTVAASVRPPLGGAEGGTVTGAQVVAPMEDVGRAAAESLPDSKVDSEGESPSMTPTEPSDKEQSVPDSNAKAGSAEPSAEQRALPEGVTGNDTTTTTDKTATPTHGGVSTRAADYHFAALEGDHDGKGIASALLKSLPDTSGVQHDVDALRTCLRNFLRGLPKADVGIIESMLAAGAGASRAQVSRVASAMVPKIDWKGFRSRDLAATSAYAASVDYPSDTLFRWARCSWTDADRLFIDVAVWRALVEVLSEFTGRQVSEGPVRAFIRNGSYVFRSIWRDTPSVLTAFWAEANSSAPSATTAKPAVPEAAGGAAGAGDAPRMDSPSAKAGKASDNATAQRQQATVIRISDYRVKEYARVKSDLLSRSIIENHRDGSGIVGLPVGGDWLDQIRTASLDAIEEGFNHMSNAGAGSGKYSVVEANAIARELAMAAAIALGAEEEPLVEKEDSVRASLKTITEATMGKAFVKGGEMSLKGPAVKETRKAIPA